VFIDTPPATHTIGGEVVEVNRRSLIYSGKMYGEKK